MSKTTYAVIILVRLATYLDSFSFLPNIISPLFSSSITQESALTNGAGLSKSNYLCINCSLVLGLTEADTEEL